ncbi:MAG: FAD-binding oxidoreductase [Betaproteobacteria bacterium]|nr:FAD-binding oxidoreductase [Betaproteobacteria bacterium]
MTNQREVVVIGAGLVGAATAFELARRRMPVLVLDCDEVNAGASGRNAGSLHFQLEPRMSDTLREDPDRLAQLLPVSLQAIDDWRRLETEIGDVGYARSGGMLIGETHADEALLHRKVELENRNGLRTQLMSGSALAKAAPYLSSIVKVASHCGEEGHADPLRVTPAYVNAGRDQGVEYWLKTRVLRVIQTEFGFDIQVSRAGANHDHTSSSVSYLQARRIVIACGAWSKSLVEQLGVQLDIRPVALTMSVTERTVPLVPHLVQHMGRKLSLKQTESGNLLIGGGWPAGLRWSGTSKELDGADTVPDSLIGNLRVARDAVPAISSLRLIRSWTGIASDTPDHLPVCGPVPGVNQAYVIGASSSFTLGPTLSKALAEIIVEGQSKLNVQHCDPSRIVIH